MKKLLSLFLLLLLLASCSPSRDTSDAAPELISAAVIDALDASARFHAADADYVEMSFDFPDPPSATSLYFGEEFGVEVGVFRFESAEAAQDGVQTINAYLLREAAAVRDLAALYPADELAARLLRYEHATVLSKGCCVAYFLLSDAERPLAEAAFRTAVQS